MRAGMPLNVLRPSAALVVLLALSLLGILPGPSSRAGGAGPPAPAAMERSTGAALRARAARDRLYVGTAVSADALETEPAYRARMAQEFSSVTPESAMKWADVEPVRGRLDFSQADALVRFARAHRQRVRGHTLVWTEELPDWLTTGTFSAGELGQLLHQHVTREVAHFRGQVAEWDVVNEALDANGSLRDTPWLRALGPDYIADAFRWAHEADPSALLFYNDFDMEAVGPKSDAALRLVGQLRGEGVRIDGVGFQGHLGLQVPVPASTAQNLRRFSDAGLATEITEADVAVPLPADGPKLDAEAGLYRLLLDACLGTPRCTGFTVWGFTDLHSWIPLEFEGFGAGDLLGESYEAKPAYDALRAALVAAAPARPPTRWR